MRGLGIIGAAMALVGVAARSMVPPQPEGAPRPIKPPRAPQVQAAKRTKVKRPFTDKRKAAKADRVKGLRP
jgi:hypothetical protein